MDKRRENPLLHFYELELEHLRGMAAEFRAAYPKIADRLALDGSMCPDPYVERLLEGFAFVAARVHHKLDAEFPRFTQSLLETVYPHYLSPTPSMLIARFFPDMAEGGLAEGFTIDRGTTLRSMMGKGDQTACIFRTAHEMTLWPIEIAEAQYYTRDIGALDLPDSVGRPRAALRLRLRATAGLTFEEIVADALTVHLDGLQDFPMLIYEQLMAHATGMVVRPAAKPAPWSHVDLKTRPRRVGFNDDEALLPFGSRSFHGYRLIQEYFTFPRRFMFFELDGLRAATERCEGVTEIDVIVVLDDVELRMENRVEAEHFLLYCTPAINLFSKRTDRIHVSDRFSEFHVVPDHNRPLDYEVYRVEAVTGFGRRSDEEQEFKPFYAATDLDRDDARRRAYFCVNRVKRQLSSREQRGGPRSRYAGSEVYVSLVDAQAAPYRSDLRQLAVETLCTNRDLPVQMAIGQGTKDFDIDVGAPVVSIRCVGPQTDPRPSYAEGEMAWRLISHLSLNYLSLLDAGDGQGAIAFRDLLELYGDSDDRGFRKQVEGLRSIETQAVTRRVHGPGPIAFARGLEVVVTLAEEDYEGLGSFLFGAVLERFFAKYVSINSFTETVVRTVERGELIRWPAQMGRRQIL